MSTFPCGKCAWTTFLASQFWKDQDYFKTLPTFKNPDLLNKNIGEYNLYSKKDPSLVKIFTPELQVIYSLIYNIKFEYQIAHSNNQSTPELVSENSARDIHTLQIFFTLSFVVFY